MALADKGKPQAPTFDELNGKPKTPETSETPAVPEGNEVAAQQGSEENAIPTVQDILNTIKNKPKPVPKTQISIYLDKEVAIAFDKFAKRYGKGAKSDLINDFLKKTLGV